MRQKGTTTVLYIQTVTIHTTLYYILIFMQASKYQNEVKSQIKVKSSNPKELMNECVFWTPLLTMMINSAVDVRGGVK